MTTFRNKNFTKRDYETTNIVACIAAEAPATPDNRWVETADDFTNGLDQIFHQGDVRYFGHL